MKPQDKPTVMSNLREYIKVLKDQGRNPLVINPVMLAKLKEYGWSEDEINQAAVDTYGFAGYAVSQRVPG